LKAKEIGGNRGGVKEGTHSRLTKGGKGGNFGRREEGLTKGGEGERLLAGAHVKTRADAAKR